MVCLFAGLCTLPQSLSLAQPGPPTSTSVVPVMMMMMPQPQQPATVRVISQVPAESVRQPSVITDYSRYGSIVLGTILIIAGTLDAVFNIVDIAVTCETLVPLGYYDSIALACHGLWGGVLVRIANQLLLLVHASFRQPSITPTFSL